MGLLNIAGMLLESNDFELWKSKMELQKKQLMAQYGINPDDINSENPESVTYADVYAKIGEQVKTKNEEAADERKAKYALKGFNPDEPLAPQAEKMYQGVQDEARAKQQTITNLKSLLFEAQDKYAKHRTLENKYNVGSIVSQIEASGYAEDVLGGQQDMFKQSVSKSSQPSIEESLFTGNAALLSPKADKSSITANKEARKRNLVSFFDNLAGSNPEVWNMFKGLLPERATPLFNMLKQKVPELASYTTDDLYDVPGVMIPKGNIESVRQNTRLEVPKAVLDHQKTIGKQITPNDILKVKDIYNLNSSDVQTLNKYYKDDLKESSTKSYNELVAERAKGMDAVAIHVNNFLLGTGISKNYTNPVSQVLYFTQTLPKDLDNGDLADNELIQKLFKDDEGDPISFNSKSAKEIYKDLFKTRTVLNAAYKNSINEDISSGEEKKLKVLRVFIAKLQTNGNSATKKLATILNAAVNSYTPPNEMVKLPGYVDPSQLQEEINKLEEDDKKTEEENIKLLQLKQQQQLNASILQGINALNTTPVIKSKWEPK